MASFIGEDVAVLIVSRSPGRAAVNYSITALQRQAQQAARASEIIVWATDRDTNNGIGKDPTAQRGILTPASLLLQRPKGGAVERGRAG